MTQEETKALKEEISGFKDLTNNMRKTFYQELMNYRQIVTPYPLRNQERKNSGRAQELINVRFFEESEGKYRSISQVSYLGLD